MWTHLNAKAHTGTVVSIVHTQRSTQKYEKGHDRLDLFRRVCSTIES